MKKIIKSTLNCTPHVLTTCSCGWQGNHSMDAPKARAELHRHMRQNDCESGSIEVGRISHYKLFKK